MASSIDASTSGAGGVITTADNTGILQLKTAGTTAVTVNASQNVGIGTTSPVGDVTRYLNIVGSGGAGIFLHDSNQGVTASDGTTLQAAGVNTYLYNREAGFIAFGTSDIERMRIDSSGNVLVGTTSQITTGGFSPKLSITNAGNAAFFTTSTNASVMGMQINTNGGDGIKFYNASASNVGNITINSGGTAYGTTSDYRLKENIAPMTGALEKVSLLKPVIYTWKTDDSNGQGFIAHELQAIIPDAVVGEKDAVNEDGSIKPQCIDTSFLVATLTAAIQEQQTIINDLKARVTALEAK
jgi:hypothetical protein